jgi:hypothetical protein
MKVGAGVAPSESPAVPARDINLLRERVRGWIAFGLVGILAVVVVLGMLGLLIGRLSTRELNDLLSSLGLLTTLVGTAMGFYFGRMTK